MNGIRLRITGRSIAASLVLCALGFCSAAAAQPARPGEPADSWVTVTEYGAGTDLKARDEAVAQALRKAVNQACGTFIRAQTKAENYQTIYDKVLANTAGYVLEHKVLKVWVSDGITSARVRARVSTRKFSEKWAAIAHTVHQADNPRVVVAIAETSYETVNTLAEETDRSSIAAVVLSVEAHRAAGALTQTDAARVGAAGVVGGRFNWRRRPRPRWYAESAAWEALSAQQRTAAYERYSATVKGAAATASSESRKVWKNIARDLEDKGAVQTRIEDFFLKKGINLVDRGQADRVSKRDLMLASVENDVSKLAAIRARFKADVVIFGTAAVKAGTEVKVGAVTMYKYPGKLVVRAVRTDSGALMISKVYSSTTTSTLRTGGQSKALDKLATEAAPKLLDAVVHAWRKRVNVSRTIPISISGMTFAQWKVFKAEVDKLRGTQALRLREITKGLAHIDVEYRYTSQLLAQRLTELKGIALEVTEITGSRIKLKVTGKPPAGRTPTTQPAGETR